MSRSTIEEQDSPATSPQLSKLYPIDRYQPAREEISHPVKGPIPLALPQLLDAERIHSRDVSTDKIVDTEEQAITRKGSLYKPASIDQWPGHLRFIDPGTSTPTIEQTSVTAHTAEHDEHHTKPRASIVKSTIRDLLSATKRRVSGKASQNKAAVEVEAPLVTVHDAKASIVDHGTIESSSLPQVQPMTTQEPVIGTNDGKSPSPTS